MVGGTGNDTFQFAGNSFGNDIINQPTPLPAVLPSHALDFSQITGADEHQRQHRLGRGNKP